MLTRVLIPFFLLFNSSCNSEKDVYDESNYLLTKTDSLNGPVGTQWFVYKYDSLRVIQVDHYEGGKLMSKAFSYNGKPGGKREVFDIDGKTLLAVDSYSNGNKVVPTKYFKPVDTTFKVFTNGKLEPFASSDSLQ